MRRRKLNPLGVLLLLIVATGGFGATLAVLPEYWSMVWYHLGR
jgi:hypothetical protein